MVLKNYKGTIASAKKLVHLSGWAREKVNCWLNLAIEDCYMSLKSVPIWETSRIATKDMDTTVGSVSKGRVMCNRVFQK